MIYLFLTLLSVVTVFPLLGVVLYALVSPRAVITGFPLTWPPDFSNFTRAWGIGQFGVELRSTLIVAGSVTVASTVFSIMAGYAFATMSFRGAKVLFYFLLFGLTMPAEAVIVPLYYDLQHFNLVDTYWGVILPDVAVAVAFGTFWMRAFFMSVPKSLFEAARIDAASPLKTLLFVLIPMARPAILTLLLLSFMWTWNDFLLPLVMLPSPNLATAPLGIANFIGRFETDQQGLAAGSIIVAAPVVILYVFLQRHFIRGVVSGASKL